MVLSANGSPYVDPQNQTLESKLVAKLNGNNHDLIDIALNSRGELFASTAGSGCIWKIGKPDPNNVYESKKKMPWVDLRNLTLNPKAKCSDIAFDNRDRLYICSGNKDTNLAHNGTIYRATDLGDFGKLA